MENVILKSLVGSRAHGLHRPDSDYDYRSVHVEPTKKILSLGFKYKASSWNEGEVDDTSYEIGHFLQLCTKANPAVLEVLLAETREIDGPYAKEMRELLPYMYNPQDAFNAFAGYSKNQQKKMLDNHLNRRLKYGVSYVRTVHNLIQLFEFGTFSLKVTNPILLGVLTDIKAGEYSDGEILNYAETGVNLARQMLADVPNRQDLGLVNEFLLKVRKDFWDV